MHSLRKTKKEAAVLKGSFPLQGSSYNRKGAVERARLKELKREICPYLSE